MNERVKPDYSIPLEVSNSEQNYALDPRYDFIRVFPWLEYGIINIVTEEGIARLYLDEPQCREVSERGGIPLVELEWICESEHESMIEVMSRPDDMEEWFNQ